MARYRWLTIAFAALTVCAVAAILFVVLTGDDDDDEPLPPTSKEAMLAFFQSYFALGNSGREEIVALNDEYPSAATDLAQKKAQYADFVAIWDGTDDGFEQLNPPHEAEEALDDLIAAERDMGDIHHDRLDRLESAVNLAEADAVFAPDEDYMAAQARANVACQALEAVANQFEITFEVSCAPD